MSTPPRAGPRPSVLEAMFEEEALGRAYDVRLLARLWRFVAPYRKQVTLTLFLVFPLFLMEIAPAWIVKTGLDRVVGPGDGVPSSLEQLLTPLAPALDGPAGVNPLLWLALLYLVVMVASSALQYLHTMTMDRTGRCAMRDLRHEVFAHIQRLHMGFFDRYPVGRLVTRATNDVENVAEMFSAGIVALVTDVLKMTGFAVALFLMNAKLATMTFLVVPILAIAALIFRLKVRNAYRLVRVRIARINTYIQENITGMKVVQLFTRERRNFQEFAHLNAEHRNAWYQSIRYDSALFSSVELAQGITIAVVISYALGVEAGSIYVFFEWMRRFFLPLRDLAAKYSVMQSSMASSERIFQLLDTEPEIVDTVRSPRLARPGNSAGAVEFDRVDFAYQGEDWVLRDVSFRVEPGEKVAFVGATGAGKTSLIKILTRLYDVTRGRILLDGVDLRELPQAELRKRVAMVLQDVFLFSGTIAENISLGRDGVDAAAIERAARAVMADRFIQTLPEGYATHVRERGSNFSAGQRQLLAFARALAHGADVLVLDEATSSIDSETEHWVQRGIHTLMEHKTALVIAHRLSTIQDMDRIYVLHKGRIVEAGTHQALLAEGGFYERLYRMQYRGDESEVRSTA